MADAERTVRRTNLAAKHRYWVMLQFYTRESHGRPRKRVCIRCTCCCGSIGGNRYASQNLCCSVHGDVEALHGDRQLRSPRECRAQLPPLCLCSNGFAVGDITGSIIPDRVEPPPHNLAAAGSSVVHYAELSKRFVAPPALCIDVIVAVFTFALVHCASAAA